METSVPALSLPIMLFCDAFRTHFHCSTKAASQLMQTSISQHPSYSPKQFPQRGMYPGYGFSVTATQSCNWTATKWWGCVLSLLSSWIPTPCYCWSDKKPACSEWWEGSKMTVNNNLVVSDMKSAPNGMTFAEQHNEKYPGKWIGQISELVYVVLWLTSTLFKGYISSHPLSPRACSQESNPGPHICNICGSHTRPFKFCMMLLDTHGAWEKGKKYVLS